MNKEWVIYCHENKINGKKYIGQTLNIEKRWHPNHYFKCAAFYRAIQKYGWNNFKHYILKDHLKTIEEANYWEIYYINYYHTWVDDPQCCGYNLQKGGNNHEVSEETKKKIAEARKGIDNVTSEFKQWMSENYSSGGNPNAKPVLCIETGKVYSCAKEAAKELKIDNSYLSKCAKGKAKTAGGYSWKYISQEEYQENKNIKVEQPIKKGTLIKCSETGMLFESMQLAANYINRAISGISTACKTGKTCGGYHWEKVDIT